MTEYVTHSAWRLLPDSANVAAKALLYQKFSTPLGARLIFQGACRKGRGKSFIAIKECYSKVYAIKEENIMAAEKESLMAQALGLEDLVSYQEGSVVSRTLLDKKAGTMTVFAFAAGEGLSEHTAPFDAFVQIIDGVAEITVDGVLHTVRAGQLIIMPANKPHALRAVQQFKMLLVMIRS
jgi:quercetin dioxygenase-like cupin family protein